MCFACCMCTTCVLGTYAGQKRVLNSLELELQTVGSQYTDAGDQT